MSKFKVMAYSIFFSIIVKIFVDYMNMEAEESRIKLENKFNILELSNKQLNANIYAREKYLNNLSEEIKSPINIMFNKVSMLLGKWDAFDRRTQVKELAGIKHIINEVQLYIGRLLEVTDKTVEISRVGNLEIVNIENIIKDILEQYEHKIDEKKLDICIGKNKLDEIALIYNVDSIKTEQAIRAVIDNAIKFSHINGTIEIFIICKEHILEIIVKDYGVSIDEIKIDQIFSPFELNTASIDQRYQINGIGLAVAKIIMHRQQGDIWLVNNKNGETGVSVHMTWSIGDNIKLYESKLSILQGLVVVVVNNSQSVLELLALILTNMQCSYKLFSNPTEAIEYIENGDADIILSEYLMEQLDGISFAKLIRDKHSTIPIIMQNDEIDHETHKEMITALNINIFPHKSYDEESIKAAITKAIKG